MVHTCPRFFFFGHRSLCLDAKRISEFTGQHQYIIINEQEQIKLCRDCHQRGMQETLHIHQWHPRFLSNSHRHSYPHKAQVRAHTPLRVTRSLHKGEMESRCGNMYKASGPGDTSGHRASLVTPSQAQAPARPPLQLASRQGPSSASASSLGCVPVPAGSRGATVLISKSGREKGCTRYRVLG